MVNTYFSSIFYRFFLKYYIKLVSTSRDETNRAKPRLMSVFFTLQGEQSKECMVFCTLVTWHCTLITGSNQHIHRPASLQQENIKKHKHLDHNFQHPGFSCCVLLSFPRKMALYKEQSRHHFRQQWSSTTYDRSRNISSGREKGRCIASAAMLIRPHPSMPRFHFFLIWSGCGFLSTFWFLVTYLWDYVGTLCTYTYVYMQNVHTCVYELNAYMYMYMCTYKYIEMYRCEMSCVIVGLLIYLLATKLNNIWFDIKTYIHINQTI